MESVDDMLAPRKRIKVRGLQLINVLGRVRRGCRQLLRPVACQQTALLGCSADPRCARNHTFANARSNKQTDSEVLRGVSRLDTWVFHVPDSNMEGLKVGGQRGAQLQCACHVIALLLELRVLRCALL